MEFCVQNKGTLGLVMMEATMGYFGVYFYLAIIKRYSPITCGYCSVLTILSSQVWSSGGNLCGMLQESGHPCVVICHLPKACTFLHHPHSHHIH